MKHVLICSFFAFPPYQSDSLFILSVFRRLCCERTLKKQPPDVRLSCLF
ncbi:hypothetical protein BAP_508 [Bacillus sp. CN2]|nr:hypothetical protein BAP_508 [Bacillus sp. CN2]